MWPAFRAIRVGALAQEIPAPRWTPAWRRGVGALAAVSTAARGRWPRLQVRDALLQLLNALEQYPDLLRLIWRGGTCPHGHRP